jgi:cytochrome b pre-mRNA-processing protein 3
MEEVMGMAWFWRRGRNRAVIERLHDEMVAAARQPAFFTQMGVADDLEGRFDLLVLHGVLVTRRLLAFAQKGEDMAQDLTDLMFARFDAALREMGVGDLAVPKRMKKLAQAYIGRRLAYEQALAGSDQQALAAVVARNLLVRSEVDAQSQALADYARAVQTLLDSTPLLVFEQGPVAFPDAAHYGVC